MKEKTRAGMFRKMTPGLCGLCLVSLFSVCPRANAETRDTWDVYYIQGSKVGYAHTTRRPVVENGRNLVKITGEMKMTLLRAGQAVTQTIILESVETSGGRLVRFQSKMTAGSAPIATNGYYENGKLHLETTSRGKSISSEVPWNPDWGGYFALEASLRRKPLRPGEQRTVRSLAPVFNQPADTHLKAADYEPTKLLSGVHKLLKINSTLDLGGRTKIDSILWTDRTGETLKEFLPGLGQQTFRTTREIALGKTGEASFDLFRFSTVKVDRLLDRPHQTRRVVYRATVKDGDPLGIFVAGPTQTVKAIDEHTAEVTVRAIRPDRPKQPAEAMDKPTADDLAPNNMLQSDDRRIVALARSVAPDQTDPWKVATALESLVHRTIVSKNFSTAFATAADVAANPAGDCTEHAVLLAALCRARKIPARVAIGLIYVPGGGGYAYHMWNEAWTGDRWVPLDGTLGRGGIGAAHLKLADSNLKGAGAYSAFLPVFPVLGRLKLQIIEVEYMSGEW